MVEDYTIKARNQMDRGEITCPYNCSARGMISLCYQHMFYACDEYKERHKKDISDFLNDKKRKENK